MPIPPNHNIVKHWFADQYQNLHPTLQQFHTTGGSLTGQATITYGKGPANPIAYFIAQGLAHKMQIPPPGDHHLQVDIKPTQNGLIWNRTFNQTTTIQSLFMPQGTIHDGFWIEQTGKLKFHLTVEIKQGGWYWKPLRIKYGNLTIPLWLFPRTAAYKTIEQGQYKFYVGFTLPLIGIILSYSGNLTAQPDHTRA